MATTTLKLKVGTLTGTKTMNFKMVKSNASSQSIKTFVSTLVANGSIYKYPPLTVEEAVLQTVTETAIDLS